jgi:hypothetical protein
MTQSRDNWYQKWLPSNGSTRYIVTSLRLFVSNSLKAYRHFFFFRGLCLWRLWSVSPFSPVTRFSRRLLFNRSRYSLLKTVRLEWPPDKVQAGPGVWYFSDRWNKSSRVVNAPISAAFALCVVSSFVSERADSSTMSHYSHSAVRWKTPSLSPHFTNH